MHAFPGQFLVLGVAFQGRLYGGNYPSSALVVAGDGALYATTSRGGALDFGTLFRMTFASVLFNPSFQGHTYSFQFNSVAQAVYRPQFTTNVSEAPWSSLPIILGNGDRVTITDTHLNSGTRFNRVVTP